jgi:hypothetical protein
MVVVMAVDMVEAMAMAMVAIPAMAMAIPAMAMVAIPAPMVLRMVMLPLRLLLHNQQHRLLASNLARNPDEPAQGCVGSFLFNDLILIINPQGFV